jgi:hypothetical protein
MRSVDLAVPRLLGRNGAGHPLEGSGEILAAKLRIEFLRQGGEIVMPQQLEALLLKRDLLG